MVCLRNICINTLHKGDDGGGGGGGGGDDDDDDDDDNNNNNNHKTSDNFTSSAYSPGIFTIDPLEVAIQSDSISPMHVLKCHWMEKLRYLTVLRNGLVITDSTYLLRAGRSGVRNPVGARFSVPVHIGPEVHPPPVQ